jgi:hypothetical protein
MCLWGIFGNACPPNSWVWVWNGSVGAVWDSPFCMLGPGRATGETPNARQHAQRSPCHLMTTLSEAQGKLLLANCEKSPASPLPVGKACYGVAPGDQGLDKVAEHGLAGRIGVKLLCFAPILSLPPLAPAPPVHMC